ncbi:MAG: LLM class flavin-dependent oxidoreductase [Acidobacteria bacterium]|nr:LLM class flavin-dependent oxidoreductase [Acidobacteriota bacterium]
MDELSKRFAALSPEQRQLLELRLKNKGLSPLPETARAVATVTPEAGESSPEALTQTGTAEVDWKQRSIGRGLRFGLYFFSGDGSKETEDKYRLVIESAKFADHHGFDAVWTPERHFQDFGGLYPNPSVLSAALAVLTERLQIRAGSVALPLHHPVRVAEEWSVIDNLSRGRVAVSFASGWHPDDFIFAPDAYDERRETMFRHIELIRKLWAGETIRLRGVREQEVEIKIMPKPLQPRLPVWITSSGSAETWSRAGEIGANVLAAYVGYADEELTERITLYRESRAAHGHDPEQGVVTLMLHTFIGRSDEAVRQKVRVPFTNYLRTYFKQYENVHVAPDAISDADKDVLMAAAFEKYFESHTLLGTPAKCARLLDRLTKLGVDEVACLVDFGVEADAVLDSLHHLNELREHYARPQEPEARPGVAAKR